MPPMLNTALTLLAILTALALIAAWLISGQITRRRQPDPPSTPADHELNFEHITFAARLFVGARHASPLQKDNTLQLGGWLVSEARRSRPTVIFCAGINGSMNGDTHFLPMFHAAGFDVLQFDWRAHGISDGQRVTMGVQEINDVLGAVDFLQARGVQKIGLMGFSMGGAIALRAAARDPRIVCVVCDGGFVHAHHAIAAGIREKAGILSLILTPLTRIMLRVRLGGIDLSAADPLNDVGRIAPRPILFIHGARDPYVPIRDQEAIFAAAGEPKSMWRVDGAGHREAHQIAPDEYRRKVIGFFKAHLT